MPSLLPSSVSNWLRPTVGPLRYAIADLVDRASGGTSMVPPRLLRQIGNGDFAAIGREFKDHLIRLAELESTSRVLDLGCGVGRIAIPLTEVLSPPGCYEGIDIVRNNIQWCSSRISPRHAHFGFSHANVFNKYYNPKGTTSAQSYRLPFDAGSFDIVFLVSVFTHMRLNEMENYVSEASRVLKQDGRLFATFFLLNTSARTAIARRTSHLQFQSADEDIAMFNPRVPEHAIAFDETLVRGLLEGSGFRVRDPIAYGSWSGHEAPLSFQDILVAHKTRV